MCYNELDCSQLPVFSNELADTYLQVCYTELDCALLQVSYNELDGA